MDGAAAMREKTTKTGQPSQKIGGKMGSRHSIKEKKDTDTRPPDTTV